MSNSIVIVNHPHCGDANTVTTAPEQDDISDVELQAIHDQVEAEIAEHGLPTEEEIRRKIAALNRKQAA